jgi:isoleucyl-tRNA synthetase
MDPKPVFEPVASDLDFPRYERRILDLWKEKKTFEAALAHRGAEAPQFVFYEGPPTANGMPHNGHVLTRVVKDLFPRYQAMRGHRVLRKGGWDTHGLPVEVEVEKELRIHGKAAIEAFGVEPFVRRCLESVFRYTSEWERQTERIAYWVSLDDAYVTFHKSYVESVWWALSELFNKGLLYQGHKVVWWWAQGGTALSSAEVGLGYKSVDDPSVYVALPLVDHPDTALLVWTTTPWTLPSNGYAAVKPGCEYVVVRVGAPSADGEKAKGRKAHEFAAKTLIVAAALRAEVEQKLGRPLEIVRTLRAEDMAGWRYRPPFDLYWSKVSDLCVPLRDGGETSAWWRVIVEDFVTLDTGTGIVHIAPAFGEDDHLAHRRQLARYTTPDAVELLCAVDPNGTFKSEIGPKYAGRWVKDADRELLEELAERRLLVHEETYRHDYPYCWRADEDPLIQLARPAWFIRTTEKLQDAVANNQAITWLPDHIKDGRFGDFLANNVDWALSRERFWGTPLNVWVCEKDAEHKHAPSSVKEIEERNKEAFSYWYAAKERDPSLSDHLMVHKPWIDQVTFPCPQCGATMRRVPEVIDVWFDSGCMPFAQWGFPHLPGSEERFADAFPADFISEAIDQTRGWFYSLLMVSTLVFDRKTQQRMGLGNVRAFPHPYKTCIVLGHVCDRVGKKESKSKGNYTPPELILDRVRMEFGVLEEAFGVRAEPGVGLIAREDLEGMDLTEGTEVAAYRLDRPDQKRKLVLRVHKKLPRRVILVSAEDRAALALEPIRSGLETMAPEVPRAPQPERLMIDDEKTPAPGADAFRWFFYASNPPWSNTRHSLTNVRTLQKDFLVKLRNVYSFFTIYANIDGWNPLDLEHRGVHVGERPVLDRWMMSELHIAVRRVRWALDNYLVYDAAQTLLELAESLSNWYVRRSRNRFWGPGLSKDKRNAYTTLYDALVLIARLIAPFVPFFAEEMYQNLVVRPTMPGAKTSVHLTDFPEVVASFVDEGLAEEMRAVREIVSLGLSVRTAQKLRVRQPLARADVVLNDGSLVERLEGYKELIREELNVHKLRFMFPGHEQGAVTFRLKPNFRALGPRLGKGVQAVKQALEAADGSLLFAELSQHGKFAVTVGGESIELTQDEVEVACEAAPGFAAETGRAGVVVLHTTLTEQLVDEGILREVMSRIQATRKDEQLEFTDRIELWLGGSERTLRVAMGGAEHVKQECLAVAVHFQPPPAGLTSREHVLGEHSLSVALRRV